MMDDQQLTPSHEPEARPQIIYVEGKGFIPIKSGQSVQEAIATASPESTSRAGVGNLGIDAGDQSFGVSLPPVPGKDADFILKTFPQIAGLIAQFTPAGKSMAGALAVPGVIEAITEAVQTGSLDPFRIAGQMALGGGGKAVGNIVEGIGTSGVEKVGRSLGLSGDLKNLSTATILPEVAIREGARMTDEGVAFAKQRAAQTGSGTLDELAQALEAELVNTKTARPNISLWPQEAASNWLRRSPRQLRMGQTMSNAREMGPAAEAMARALAIYSQSPNTETRRRRQP